MASSKDKQMLGPTNQSLYPTLDSLQAVVELADSQVPITSKNDITTLLMIYHNTLLKVLNG
jgi:hypothetical protein